jgi:hypothetical protein
LTGAYARRGQRDIGQHHRLLAGVSGIS